MNYLDTIYYKDLHQLYNFLLNKNHTNIIIYNHNINDKIRYIKILLDDLNYDYFYIEKFNKEDILNIIKTKNYNNKIKYILLDQHQNNNNNHKLKIIKSFIDKYYQTSRFIILTDNLNNYNNILSYFIIIKFKNLTKYDKMINNKDNNDINNLYLIKKLFLIYQKYSLKKIKEYSNNLILLNITYHIFFKELLEYIITLNINIKKKSEIIFHISNYERLIKKAYKEIIFLESLFIKIYKIIYIDD